MQGEINVEVPFDHTFAEAFYFIFKVNLSKKKNGARTTVDAYPLIREIL